MLVDGKARVACVTPARRVAGRQVTTVDGLPGEVREAFVAEFVGHGASQCGFCTPGIVCRLSALGVGADAEAVESALLAHLCRCTGWRTVVDAGVAALREPGSGTERLDPHQANAEDTSAAARRAELEGGVAQRVGPEVVLGKGGFAVDTVPAGALVAVPDGLGDWSVAPSLVAARAAVVKVQGRRSGLPVASPIALPDGDWALTLSTTWVEPGYLEPDSSWCEPGGVPYSPVANGGAFGAKLQSPAPEAARMLADRTGKPVLVVLSREDSVRLGPKRPPIAAGVRADGTGIIRVAATAGIAEAIATVAPGLQVDEVSVIGPPTSASIRAAGWAEAAILLAGLRSLQPRADLEAPPSPESDALRSAGVVSARGGAGSGQAHIVSPSGGSAHAGVTLGPDGRPAAVKVRVYAGCVLDPVVLRSYVTGAAHMALGWVRSEGVAVDDEGSPVDLTIRSWGVLRARDTPPIEVEFDDSPDFSPLPASDAAFAAVAAAVWIAEGLPPTWPTHRGDLAR